MKDSVTVNIHYFDGQEEDDLGHPYFVASCDDLSFTTQGDSFEDLLSNIRECLELTLHDVDSQAEYGVSPHERVQLVMDMPEYA